MNPTPLKQSALAPNFSLPSTHGEIFTRAQYRNKAGLALLFVPSTDDPAIKNLLSSVQGDLDSYRKLGAKVFVIAHSAPASEVGLPTLIDIDGKAWQHYSDQQETGYGVFVLDRYGGVDSQIVTTNLVDLPDADTVRKWVQSAMYKCNI